MTPPPTPQPDPQGPADPTPPPAYPQEPQYPGTPAAPAAPSYPQEPQYPQEPYSPPQPPQPHPHELTLDQRRVHLAERQRGADAAAIGGLFLHVPNFLCSLVIVGMVALFLGGIGLILVLLWLLSGLLIFNRAAEGVIARHLLRLRYPTQQELARLQPVWHEVTARAGVEGRTYQLWIEDSDDLNAVAAAGHIVGVTRFAVDRLPSGQLAAVLAHELGHHIGGHSWSTLLGYWYALPGRLAWRVVRGAAAGVRRFSGCLSCFGAGLIIMVFGGLVAATVQTLYGLPLLLLVMPYAIAATGRRAELRADQQAAALGFAPMLVEVLDQMERAEHSALPLGTHAGHQQDSRARLLASHPDHHTRLHHLQPYLRPRA
ncbi:peptidase [Streptomyces kanamyceticus]|uniref:Peptidase n=1 Tax=Streptomyces kanamyceticus TaxID=1967 RepID=A0A5J6GEW1_STRKN|nr:M48 family metalloprotease [Streptomyces kanamyceticus]QEU92451.1 peptidase [Streptomyces kanamyceticus]